MISAVVHLPSLDGKVGRWTPTHSIALRVVCGVVHLFTPIVNVSCDCAPSAVQVHFLLCENNLFQSCFAVDLLCCVTQAMLGLADKVNFLLLRL